MRQCSWAKKAPCTRLSGRLPAVVCQEEQRIMLCLEQDPLISIQHFFIFLPNNCLFIFTDPNDLNVTVTAMIRPKMSED